MYVTLHLMLFELVCVCVCISACVIRLFIDAVKKFCCAKRHKSGSSEAWACIGRLRHTAAANFPCENVNRQSQLAHSTLIHCSVHNAPWKDWSKNLAVRVIWRLRTHFPPYKVIARARVFMQGIELLAASGDGGNVSPDGCHTPVVKEFFFFFYGWGPLHAEPAGSESRAGS